MNRSATTLDQRPGRWLSGGAATPWTGAGGRLGDAALIAWLFIANGALFPLLAMGTDPNLSHEDSAALRLLLVPGIALAFGITVLRPRQTALMLLRLPWLPLLIAWVWASTAWSIDPATTIRRAVAFTAYTLIALHLAMRFTPERIIFWLAVVCLVQLGLSVAFAVALPAYGYMPDGGQLRGVFTHKNSMGELLLMAGAVLAATWPGRLIPRWLAAAGLVLVFGLALPTGSATALALLALLAVLLAALLALRLPHHVAALLIGLGVSLAALATALVLLDPAALFELLGRDPTLTGRAQLWAFVDQLIAERPWLGYGYRTVFAQPWVQAWVVNALGWPAPHAHNGYREIMLDLGLVGLLLVLPILLGTLVRAVRRLLIRPDALAVFGFLVLAGYLLRNLTEADLLHQTKLVWVLVVLAAFHLRGLGRPAQDDAATVAGPQPGPIPFASSRSALRESP